MRTIILAALTCMLALPAMQGPDISGVWVAKRESPGGEQELVWELKVTDGRITGMQKLPQGDSPIVDGSISGNEFEFTVENDFGGNVTRQVVKGQIEGDTLVITLPPGGRRGGAGRASVAPGSAPGVTASQSSPGGTPAAPAAGAPGAAARGGRGGFPQGPVTARRGTPTPTYRAERVNYAALPTVELPAVRPLPYNGLAKTPPMGFNTWNKFHTRIDDKTIREIADAMVASGMRDAGYHFINIDDGWEWKRDDNGVLQPNPHFPDMKALADYVHSKGLKLGIYSSPGPTTCGGYTGSYGHEEIDAKTWAAWGIDYLKYDWCSASRIWKDTDMPAVYQRMGEALRKTGRPIVFSLCQYGRAAVQEWGPRAGGNLWRTTGDIRDQYESMAAIGFAQSDLAQYAGPGHWNDPDMLEVGNGGMSTPEYQTHMALWALLAAPLIAGNDLRAMSPETKGILLNKDVIAVDQDPLGKAATRLSQSGSQEVWSRPLSKNAYAVGLFNRGTTDTEMRLNFADLKLSGEMHVRDLWTGSDRGRVRDQFTASVPAHGVAMIKLSR
jgi:alpha-galactosidase